MLKELQKPIQANTNDFLLGFGLTRVFAPFLPPARGATPRGTPGAGRGSIVGHRRPRLVWLADVLSGNFSCSCSPSFSTLFLRAAVVFPCARTVPSRSARAELLS